MATFFLPLFYFIAKLVVGEDVSIKFNGGEMNPTVILLGVQQRDFQVIDEFFQSCLVSIADLVFLCMVHDVLVGLTFHANLVGVA